MEDRKDKNLLPLDVRSREEYNDELGHLKNSVLIPIDELEDRVGELAHEKSKTVIAYCGHGIRSARAVKFLSKEGFTVVSLMGGLTKWNRESLPVSASDDSPPPHALSRRRHLIPGPAGEHPAGGLLSDPRTFGIVGTP